MRMKKLTAWTLTAAMLSSMLPAPVFAAGSNADQTLESLTQTFTAQVSPEFQEVSNDELFAAYADSVLYGYEMVTFGTLAGSKFEKDSIEQKIYSKLKEKIAAVATSGGSTAFTLTAKDLGITTEWTNTSITTQEQLNAFVANAKGQIDALELTEDKWSNVFDALLQDCPYELYWFHKSTNGAATMQYGYSMEWDDELKTLFFNDLSYTFTFQVAQDYQGTDNTHVATAVSRVSEAKAEADRLVDEVNGKYSTNYEKLVAYKEYICNAVSYNDAAAGGGYQGGYGDPWQLIYVFDKDTTNQVVCEGYSKALQYLCDLDDLDENDSTPTQEFDCLTATGTMGGPHMWNMVNLNGEYYLVDVTNCDGDTVNGYTVGYPDKLFLRAATLPTSTYRDLNNLTYEYDAESQALMNGLTLAKQDYAHVVTYPVTIDTQIQNGTVTASPASAAEGAEVTLTVTPDEGYALTDLTVKRGGENVAVNDNKFIMPAGAVTVTATFAEHTHAWTYTASGATITATCGNTDGGCPIEGETKTVTLTLVAPEDLDYDGTPKTVTVKQTADDKTVTAFTNEDLKVSYGEGIESAIDAGDYTATLTMGGKTATLPFEITALNITDTTKVTVGEFAELIYQQNEDKTAKEQTPVAEVKIGDVVVEGTWSNVSTVGQKTTFVPTKASNFTHTLEMDPSMAPAEPNVTAPTAVAGLTYNTAAQALVTAGETTFGELKYSLEENGTYVTGIPTGKDAKTYTVYYKVEADEDGNWNAVEPQSVTVTIAPKTVTEPTFDGLQSYYVHTGKAIEPTFTLKDGEAEIPISEYTVEYGNNVNEGTDATITITDKEGGNYAVSGSTTFEIKKHTHDWKYTASDNTITATCDEQGCPNSTVTLTLNDPDESTSLTYDGKAKAAEVTQSTPGTFAEDALVVTYALGADAPTTTAPKDAGDYTATISMGEGVSVSVDFTIAPKNIAGAAVGTFGQLTYTGSAQTPVATVTIDGLTATGTWSAVTNVADKTTFTANGNFIGTVTADPKMAKAKQENVPKLTVNAPSLKGKADGSITGLTTDMEYTTTKDGEYKTIENNQLKNLAAGTYYVRYKETENYEAGTAVEVVVGEGKPITVIFDANEKTFAAGFTAELKNQSYDTKLTKPTDPKATDEDYAFVGWYKDSACQTAWDFETDILDAENVTLYAKWKQVRFDVTVNVQDHNSQAYTDNVTVKLMRGSDEKYSVSGKNDQGSFTFENTVEVGTYNLVATYANGTKTELVTVEKDDTITINLPAPGIKSQLTVKDDSNTPDIMVGGLDQVAASLKPVGSTVQNVLVTMDVEGKKKAQVKSEVVEKIEEAITGNAGSVLSAVVEYLAINITKNVDGTEDAITETTNVIEIVVPFNFAGRNDVKIVRHHVKGDGSVEMKTFTESDSKTDGQFSVDKTNGYIHIFANQFSTYAISYTTNYTIAFDDVNGNISTKSTNSNGIVASWPEKPTCDGYTFNGWYTASTGGTQVTENTVFTGDTTVYAQWTQNSSGSNPGSNSNNDYSGGNYYTPSAPTYPVSAPTKVENGSVSVSFKNASKGSTVTLTVTPDEGYELASLIVTDKNGNELTLTNKGNGKFSFIMPASKVSIKATFEEITAEPEAPVNPFYDIAEGDYYFDAVLWANEHGITSGVGYGLFAPHATCTRAQMVTFLWNAAGCPNVSADYGTFTDVTANDYYYKAVLWANANNITSGTGNGAFSPNQICTRAQMATFLYQFAEGQAEGTYNPFVDITANDYYAQPVQWAVENGITSGTGANTFGPNDPCTRAQMVTFLYRLLAE